MADKIPPEDAHQGERGFRVVMVLVFALFAAAVVWWGVEVYGTILDAEQVVETPASGDASSDASLY